MNGEEMAVSYNSSIASSKMKNIRIIDGCIFISIYKKELNNTTIKTIARYINYVHTKYRNSRLPIILKFEHRVQIVDKLAYIIFECLVDTLISKYRCNVCVFLNFEKTIISDGIRFSPLLFLNNNLQRLSFSNKNFLKKFNSECYNNHYRKVLKYEEYAGTDQLSKIYDDLVYFQKNLSIENDCREEISEVIVELLGNAIEHSCSDCLLDFDVSDNYININNGERVCGINIVILNFSNFLLGDKLCDAICNKSDRIFIGKYKEIQNAYQNHNKFFNDSYTQRDFFHISTFQNKVSSRGDNRSTGGTGLTKLIKTIEDKSRDHACYVLTGDRIIIFDQKYLEYDGDWIGFNSSNDYFNDCPCLELLKKSDFYMPGTAYNLSFIMKVSEQNDESELL